MMRQRNKRKKLPTYFWLIPTGGKWPSGLPICVGSEVVLNTRPTMATSIDSPDIASHCVYSSSARHSTWETSFRMINC
jgi:hypothetical protein